MDHASFLSPPTLFRPAPFWAINDRLTPEECARQMHEMLDAGLSGGYFHSRPGLVTDYLSEEWFDAYRAVVEVARARGGYAWLYDDDCWPSGNAGGLVSAVCDDYRAATLQAFLLAPGAAWQPPADAEVRAIYRLEREGTWLARAERLAADDPAVERLLIARVYGPKNFLCWGNETPANLLNPEAVQHFIRITHDAYAARFGTDFGGCISAIFTDEPGCVHSGNAFPWYEGLPALYQRWHDADWWADLPYLFFEGAQARAIRLRLHRAILRQFCESYTAPIADWCARHGLELTGHYCGETSLMEQLQYQAGSIMAHYRYMDMPGCDQVGPNREGELLTLKQVSSAARQLGRPRVLTELFGGLQHSCTFEGFKSVGDYHLVHGANIMCPHLSWYTLRGRRKEDYPPTWSYQQSYFPELRSLTDYFTRVGFALACGQAVVDVLLLHPMDSAIAGRRLGVAGGWDEDRSEAETCDAALRRTLDAILTTGIDCDLGDEAYLAEMGAVEGDRLRVGNMAYRVVVIPLSRTWQPATVALLREFIVQDGRVIVVGELPTEIDGESAGDVWGTVRERALQVPCDEAAISDAIMQAVPADVLLRDPDGHVLSDCYLQHRRDGEQDIYFLINVSQTHTRHAVLTLRGKAGYVLTHWDAVSGGRGQCITAINGNDLKYRFSLPPAGSLLLVLDTSDENLPLAQPLSDWAGGDARFLPETWAFTRDAGNVLVLDRMSVSVDGGVTWWDEDTVQRLRRPLMRHFGTDGAHECQPWIAARKGWFTARGGEARFRYTVTCALDDPGAVALVFEQDGSFSVNGTPVETAQPAWHWDRIFRKVEITGLLRRGENVIEQQVAYDYLTEVTPLYLVGDFGVCLSADGRRGEMIPEPPALHNGDWTTQGYPFYTGRLIYRTEVEWASGTRALLRLRQPSGTLFTVRVNGRHAGRILWQPHVLELTAFLQPGANLLEIEVVSSLQNSLGPLRVPPGVDPNAVNYNPARAGEAYTLYPYGLLDGAEIVTL
jgi:hypothetical protein